MKGRYLLIAIAFLVIAAVVFVQVGDVQTAQAAAPAPICMDSLDEPTMSTIFLPYQLSPCGPQVEIPFYDEWVDSPHNAYEDEAFRHWDDDGEIEEDCAKCHSTPGYEDFLGADGSEPGVVNQPAELGTTIECVACHNDVTLTKESVKFPSGVTIEHLGDESRCMECHQGRESGPQLDKEIADAGMTEDVDTVSTDLDFLNVHYYAAAATQYGNLVYGGYQYYPMVPEGGPYDVNFRHVEEYDQCYECHDMHTLKPKLNECAHCHASVETTDDLKDVRMLGSLADYDGDGDMEEGIYYEIDGLKMMLYDVIQQYGNQVSGQAICYAPENYPYWMKDTNENGTCDPEESNYGNGYKRWTARLLKAAYNYMVVSKDGGGYTHGGKYLIQLMHDSIYDLNDSGIDPGMDMVTADRDDPGHFAGSSEAWRHWDAARDGGLNFTVSGRCSKCHTADGIPFLHAEGVSVTQETANGMMCSTCHNPDEEWPTLHNPDEEWPTLFAFDNDEVIFPSEAATGFGNGAASNICAQCHMGRQSGLSVVEEIEGVEDDTVMEDKRMTNIHYLAAASTLFASDVTSLYEYEGKDYNGQFMHVPPASECVECHNTHEGTVKAESCAACHGTDVLKDIRGFSSAADYDGDGDTTEGIYGEIETMLEDLLAAMNDYAAITEGVEPIEWTDNRFYIGGTSTRYNTWTPRMFKGGYNYRVTQLDEGQYAHNAKYILQGLYDALEDIGGDMTGKVRP